MQNVQACRFRLGAGVVLMAGMTGFLSAGAAIAASPVATDSLQVTETSEPEIVVTAQRRSESISRVPISVSAITGVELAERHVTHLGELSAQVPNVEINSPRGSSLTDIVIRGVGIANDFTLNQASPVGVYLDDSYRASRTFSAAQAYDLERVEILRGPQGTLFGRNTTGGLVNFVTRSPTLGTDRGYLEAGFGNFNDVRLQGAVEIAPQEGVFGVRASGTFHRHGGYFDNINPGQPDVENLNTLAGRLAFRLKPVEGVDLSLKLYGQRDKNRQWNVRVKLVGADAETPAEPFDVNLTPGSFRTSSFGAQFNVAVDLSATLSLATLTSYDRGHLSLDAIDLDGRPGGATSFGYTVQFQNTRFEQVNQEVRLNYRSDRLTGVLGAYFGQDTVRDNVRYDVFSGFPLSPRFRYNQLRRSAAVFAQSDLKIGPDVTLTTGLRYTHDLVSYRDGHADVFTPGVPGGVLNTLPGAFTPACAALNCPSATLPDIKGSNSALTGRAALQYDFAPGQMAYLSFSRGYRSGAFNGNAYLAVTQLQYVKPESVNAFEIGNKGRLADGKIQYALAAFYNDYRDQQINFLSAQITGLGTFPVNVLGNVPRAKTYGFEAEGSVKFTGKLSAHFAAGLLSANYKANSVVAGLAIGGNRLPYAPKVSGTAGFDWTLAEPEDGLLTFSPSVVYSSGYYFDPTNNSDVQTEGFTRVNARLTWKGDRATATVWINNLFNNKYNGFGLDLSANTGNFYYNAAPPLTFGIALSRSF